MPEHVALAEQVEHAAVVDERDRAPADHAHHVLRTCSLLEDRRAGDEVLHLDACREAVEHSGVKVAEGGVIFQEGSDVLHVVPIICRDAAAARHHASLAPADRSGRRPPQQPGCGKNQRRHPTPCGRCRRTVSSTVPGPRSRSTGSPTRRSNRSAASLPTIMPPVKCLTPFATAASARRSASMSPTPRCCQLSRTTIAASASAASPQTYRAIPTPSPVAGSIAT